MIIREAKRTPIMQNHQPNREKIESAGDGAGKQAATAASTQPWDFMNPNQDEVLALLKPGGDRTRTIILAGSALVVGLGLGWAGGANIAAFNPITQTEMPSRPEIKSSGKIDGARRTAITPGLQTSPGAGSTAGPGPFAKPQAASPGARLSVDSTTSATQASTTLTAREPLVPVAETRPTTIEGWTVLEVRGGTVVLEGPDGVQTAARGDTVPGIGRIDSIVRWGNRWIVATASGLIATP
jgi:hypothetical protein